MSDFFHTARCLSMSGPDAAKTIIACVWLGAYLKPHFFGNSVGQFVMTSIFIASV